MANKSKKKKQTMSLGQFLQSGVDGDSGSGVAASQAAPAASQIVRINWADEMEKLDDDSPPPQFVFDRSKLPTAPKSVLKSELDLDLIPKSKPFRAYIANISFEADEEKLRSFFKDLKIAHVHLATDQGGRSRGSGHIEFEDRESLIAVLNKNEAVFLNRPLRISLSDTIRGGNDRTGGYGERREQGGGFRQQSSESSALRSDEASWRREPDTVDSEPHQSYQRYQGGQGGNRYQSGGSGGGYQNRRPYAKRNDDDTGSNSGAGGGRHQYQYQHQQQQQRRPYYQKTYSRDTPTSETGGQETSAGGDRSPVHATQTPPQVTSPTTSISEVKERPKLNLNPRTLPVGAETNAISSSSIFGGAKPVNTAARERQIEERIEKERKEREKNAAAVETGDQQQDDPTPASNADAADSVESKSRSHKTSITSDDQNQQHAPSHQQQQHYYQQQHRSHEQDQHGKQKHHYHKHDNNNNNSTNNNNRNNMTQSNSFTSPSSNHQHRQHESKPAENAWKTRNASDLFNSNNNNDKTQNESSDMSRSHNYSNNSNTNSNFNNNERRPYNNEDSNNNNRRPPNKRPDSQQQYQNRNHSNRDNNNKDRRQGSGYNNKQGARNQNQRQYNNNDRNSNTNRTERQQHYGQAYDASNQDDSHSNQDNLGFANKFANLKIDVDGVESDY